MVNPSVHEWSAPIGVGQLRPRPERTGAATGVPGDHQRDFESLEGTRGRPSREGQADELEVQGGPKSKGSGVHPVQGGDEENESGIYYRRLRLSWASG